jgi:prolipoprotein diacylglyceryltransferase
MIPGLWTLQPYTWGVLRGALIGLLWLECTASWYKISRREVPGILWAVTAGTIVFGRLGYVSGQSAYFLAHPAAIFTPEQAGGLYGGSAWLGGLLGAWIWRRYHPGPLLPLLSWLTPAALVVATGAWWGCWDAGCAWGQEVSIVNSFPTWMTIRAPDLYHTVALRMAVQPAGMVAALALLVPAIGWRRRGAWVWPFYWLIQAGLAVFRADPLPLPGLGRIDLWIDLGLAVLFAGLCFRLRNEIGVRPEGKDERS